MFTENLREAFRTMSLGRRMFLKLYSMTRIPFAPIYGGFPVKMITHVGKPIMYDPCLTPEQLQCKVNTGSEDYKINNNSQFQIAFALNELIAKHQRLPGNILHALLDRIPYFKGRHKAKDPEKHNE